MLSHGCQSLDGVQFDNSVTERFSDRKILVSSFSVVQFFGQTKGLIGFQLAGQILAVIKLRVAHASESPGSQ